MRYFGAQTICSDGVGRPEGHILGGFVPVSSNQNSLSSFHMFTVLGCFVTFFGDFWVYLGIKSFSQRTSEIYGNKKIDDLCCFKIRI